MTVTFKVLKQKLYINYNKYIVDIAIMALTHIQTIDLSYDEKVNFYIQKLNYTLNNSRFAIQENEKAYMFMLKRGFDHSSISLLANRFTGEIKC